MKKLLIAARSATSWTVHAAYPERPVRLIAPAAGGATDNIFRPFAQVWQKHLGQTVVIANVGGASRHARSERSERRAARRLHLYAVQYIHSTYQGRRRRAIRGFRTDLPHLIDPRC